MLWNLDIHCLGIQPVYQDASHLYNDSTKNCQHFNYLALLPHVNCIKAANLVSCRVPLVLFPDDGPSWTRTCRSVMCDMI